MPVKQHVQEVGSREEDEGGVCLGHSGCVVLGQGSWDVDQKSLHSFFTPGNGHVHPFCSQQHWGPYRSTHLVYHRTWGMESPRWERQNKNIRIYLLLLTLQPQWSIQCMHYKFEWTTVLKSHSNIPYSVFQFHSIIKVSQHIKY